MKSMVLLGLFASLSIAAPSALDPGCWDQGEPCQRAEAAGLVIEGYVLDAATANDVPDNAVLTARHALNDLANTIGLAQRDPTAFLNNINARSDLSKRDPEPWCAASGRGSCWRYTRDVAGTEQAKMEQRRCLAEGGECALARRAALSVLDSIGEGELQKRQYTGGGNPAPGGWCLRNRGSCYKKRGQAEGELQERQYTGGGNPAPGGWCLRNRGSCYKKRSQLEDIALAARSVLDSLTLDE